ncbi:MAG: RluA family pseudouridine synthase [Andreesenia angusta]|nr:RluA family pseudouridine synthase [Andreesenia angusta]
MNDERLVFKSEDEGERLDIYLKGKLKEYSRSQIQKLIKSGNVLVNREEKNPRYKVKREDIIEVLIESEEESDLKAENIDLDIIYEDDDLAVVFKPQGMVVHPANGNRENTLVNALLYHFDSLSDINDPEIRPGIVHRIDKDTSGILMIAKNNMAHKSLARQLKDHTVVRKYIALVEGNISEENGIIDSPIGRSRSDRKKMDIVEDGRRAITHYRVLERYERNTLIEAKLETGRTHQIRVHMKSINHPVVGDSTYGIKKQRFTLEGQLLHAETIGFIHPRTGEYMEFNYPLPEYFKDLIEKLKKLSLKR